MMTVFYIPSTGRNIKEGKCDHVFEIRAAYTPNGFVTYYRCIKCGLIVRNLWELYCDEEKEK